MKSAAKSYKESFNNSADPLVKILNDVGGTLSNAAGKVFKGFGGGGTNGGAAADQEPSPRS